MQTNKINGIGTISLALGLPLKSARVGLKSGGTLNQKLEAAEVEVGYYCLAAPSEREAVAAMQRCIDLIDLQRFEGFMGTEVWTDSHSPIYLRAMCALRLWTLRMRKRASTGKPVAGLSKLDRLEPLLSWWFEAFYASCQLGLVPSGPLAGHILLPCNRKSADEKRGIAGGVTTPDDMCRRVWFGALSGIGVERVGRDFFTLALDRPDTASGPLTKMVLAEGGFAFDPKAALLPKLCTQCIAETYRDGHHIYFTRDLPGSDPWSAKECWVKYSTGEYAFDGRPEPDLGAKLSRTLILSADGAGDAS